VREDDVRVLEPPHLHIGRNLDDAQAVDVAELGRLRAAVPVIPDSFLYMRK